MSKGLESICLSGYKYKEAGVMLMDTSSEEAYQMNLWNNIDQDKHKRLMEVPDMTKEKWGRNSLNPATLGNG